MHPLAPRSRGSLPPLDGDRTVIPPSKIRNLAIVAHIDHGKTTLIDSLFRATRTFRENARIEERVMDSHDLEKERGITIRAKHCTVEWQDYRINIVDTPGHSDFSGEVERILSMVDGVLLLVDANEGPMPQTRYVTMRALRLGLKPVVLVNKVDRPNADPVSALDKTLDLFIELGADETQIDFPVLYGSGLNGWAVRDLANPDRSGMDELFQTLVDSIPAPAGDPNGTFRMQVCTLGWSDYLGRLACGKVLQGSHTCGAPLDRLEPRQTGDGPEDFELARRSSARSQHLWVTQGLDRVEVETISTGDIVWLSTGEDLSLGDTLAAPGADAMPLPPLEIEEPTVTMNFMVNSGPFSGNDGTAVTIRTLRERLDREARVNLALRVEDSSRSDAAKVSGRGELHLAILIEEMRREGLEFCVSRPEVITRKGADESLLEPYEELVVDVPEEHQGTVINKLAPRKGELEGISNAGTGIVRLRFAIPTRGLLGYRSEFLTDTRGLGILSSRVRGYGPWAGEIRSRTRGSMVSMAEGEVTSHALETLQQRSTMFVVPGDDVYEGMVIGENSRPDDLVCNPTRRKHVTNHRSATREIDVVLKTPRKMTLDQALEWIAADELVEVTPKSVRLRKVLLGLEDRKRAEKALAQALAAG